MRKAKAVNSELAIAKESTTISYILVENQRQAERESFGCGLVGGCWREEALSTTLESRSIENKMKIRH